VRLRPSYSVAKHFDSKSPLWRRFPAAQSLDETGVAAAESALALEAIDQVSAMATLATIKVRGLFKGNVMSDDLVMYYSPMSRARITHWMLEEVGAPYKIQLVNLARGEHKRPEFLAVNPMGKLPALVHRGTVITESGAICTYLGDAFPAAGLAPPNDSAERGTYLRWLFFGAGCIDPCIIDRMLSRPVPDMTAALGYGTYEDMVKVLEKSITPGPYILGERFSTADVYVGSQIGFGLMQSTLEPRPAFTAYMERLTQRPAYKRFMEQTEKYTAQMQASA
jgi:glutathione S-transferase